MTQGGVTIIELMIVVGIGASLAAIAVPSLRDTLLNTRQSSALGLIINDLNQARGESIKRNVRMLVCVREVVSPAPLDPSTNLVDRCSASTDWRRGWVVCMTDIAATQCVAPVGAPNPVPNPVIVRPALDANLNLAVLDATATAINSVRFNPNSTSAGAVTMSLSGTWSGAPTRTVTVAATGNISKQ